MRFHKHETTELNTFGLFAFRGRFGNNNVKKMRCQNMWFHKRETPFWALLGRFASRFVKKKK